MMEALKRLKKVPSDSKLQHIFQVLDQDKDGNIDINDALKVSFLKKTAIFTFILKAQNCLMFIKS